MPTCKMCGSTIPKGQDNICSMCYGDIAYGKDGFYRAEMEKSEQREQEREQEVEHPVLVTIQEIMKGE